VKAVRDIVTGKTFDNGVLCSSENAVVVDSAVADEVRRQFLAHGGHFLSPDESAAVARVLVTPQRLPNPALVGKSAAHIAQQAGITVPKDTRVLLAPLQGVGRDYPLSIEKLCPVLAFYVVTDWREACERCKEILRYGGMGHTMAIHSRDDQVILEFGLKKPAFRICVNTPTTHGSIGLTTGLEPAMTLGCGGYGGNITSDNITPRHLINVKRLAYEVRPAEGAPTAPALASGQAPPAGPHLQDGPARPPGLAADVLLQRVDAVLSGRSDEGPSTPGATPDGCWDFVCEEDVRLAVRDNRKIRLADRAIVTPAARDLAEANRVFE
jgi:acetaldehyde dehydrogenase (acetylating)